MDTYKNNGLLIQFDTYRTKTNSFVHNRCNKDMLQRPHTEELKPLQHKYNHVVLYQLSMQPTQK